jgi:hypothetical protein
MEVTRRFFDILPTSKYAIYASVAVLEEIIRAPEEKRLRLLGLVGQHSPTILNIEPAVNELADAYISHGVLPINSRYDALHIAFSSVNELDFVVSWNLKHIANVTRQERAQAVNLMNGYTKPIQLITPMEVSHGKSED